MKEIGNAGKQEIGRWANNMVQNSHLPFRRRDRATVRFRQMKTLQEFISVHAAQQHGHPCFGQEVLGDTTQGPLPQA